MSSSTRHLTWSTVFLPRASDTMNITQSNLSADIDPVMDSELFSSPSWECSDPTMLYRDCLKEFLAEQSTSLICEQPPRILPSYRKGQWTLPSKIDRQTLFEQQPGVISGIGGPAKQRRWWASGDRSVDRGCPWTNSQFESSQFESAQSICWSMQWHRQSTIQPFFTTSLSFFEQSLSSCNRFRVQCFSFELHLLSVFVSFYSSSFFHWVSLPLSIVFRVQGSRVQVISERSSDIWLSGLHVVW